MSNFKRIGIMGGTFDPIHFGHLVTAEAARDSFKLERVFFVPSGNPPHKKNYPVTDAEHRYLMTNLAVTANPYFEVSPIEIERKGYSYTIDTVTEFYNKYKDQAELYFITGADAILEILTWKSVERITELCSLIAATRPETHLEELQRFIKELPNNIGEKIHIMEVPALAISSTDIRRRVANHRTIKYLLPDAVEQYIVKKGLYQS